MSRDEISVARGQRVAGRPFTHVWPTDKPGALNPKHPHLPGDGNPYRCQGTTRNGRHAGEQCWFWSMRGTRWCKVHGGKSCKNRASVKVSKFYSRRAGPELRKVLEEQASSSPDERMSLLEEVDLMRMLALENVQMFEAICIENRKGTDGAEPSNELKAMVTSSCRRALEAVTETVLKAAKTRSLNEAVVDVQQIDYIVAQILAAIETRVKPVDELLYDQLSEDLKKIRLPERAERQRQALASSASQIQQNVRDMLKEMEDKA